MSARCQQLASKRVQPSRAHAPLDRLLWSDRGSVSNRGSLLLMLDKLGVTASSPVPPIEKALHKGFFVALDGNGWSGGGKDRPCHFVR
jgi:hypothetical protein